MEDQQLKRQLSGFAADLKWSAVELARIAERLSHSGNDPDAQALQRMITVLRKDEESLDALGDQVRKGQSSYQKAEVNLSCSTIYSIVWSAFHRIVELFGRPQPPTNGALRKFNLFRF